MTELKKKWYTNCYKHKEHINLEQREKKCPEDISTSTDGKKHSIFATTNFNYAKEFYFYYLYMVPKYNSKHSCNLKFT